MTLWKSAIVVLGTACALIRTASLRRYGEGQRVLGLRTLFPAFLSTLSRRPASRWLVRDTLQKSLFDPPRESPVLVRHWTVRSCYQSRLGVPADLSTISRATPNIWRLRSLRHTSSMDGFGDDVESKEQNRTGNAHSSGHGLSCRRGSALGPRALPLTGDDQGPTHPRSASPAIPSHPSPPSCTPHTPRCLRDAVPRRAVSRADRRRPRRARL